MNKPKQKERPQLCGRSSRYRNKIACATDELSKTGTVLPPELLPVLKRLTDVHLTVNSLTVEACYVDGSRTGAKFMHDDNAGRNQRKIGEAAECGLPRAYEASNRWKLRMN